MIRILAALSLLLALGQPPAPPPQAPTPTELIDRIEQDLKILRAQLPPPLPTAPLISTPELLDAAIAGGMPIITLAPTLVYPKPLTLAQPVILQSAVPLQRIDRATPLPSFTGGLTITGLTIQVIGVEVRHPNPLTDIVIVTGLHDTLDRVRVLGDPVKGAKRGVSGNSAGDLKILRSYIADCFLPLGQDSQAIAAWDMGAGLFIDDTYLEGGSESFLIGGADPSSDARRPRDVTLIHSTVTKNPAWMPLAIGVKNIIELKNVERATITDNDISYSWGGHGQDGYAVVFTVRNQDGRDPGATIKNVTFTNNRIAHAAAALNILGLDAIKESLTGSGRVPIGQVRPSVRATGITIANNTWTDLDPVAWKGSAKLIIIEQVPDDLTIDQNVFTGAVYNSAVYFSGGAPGQRVTFTTTTVPRSTYGMFGVGVTAKPHLFTAINPAWLAYTAASTISGITETP